MALQLTPTQIRRLITVCSRNLVSKRFESDVGTYKYTSLRYCGLGLIVNIIVNRYDRYAFRDIILKSFHLAYTTPDWLRTISHYYGYSFGLSELYQAIDNCNKELVRFMILKLHLHNSKAVIDRIMTRKFWLPDLISLKEAAKPDFCLLAIHNNNIEALELGLRQRQSLKVTKVNFEQLKVETLTYLLKSSQTILCYDLLTQIITKNFKFNQTLIKLVKNRLRTNRY